MLAGVVKNQKHGLLCNKQGTVMSKHRRRIGVEFPETEKDEFNHEPRQVERRRRCLGQSSG
jgi:hypothetical protein